MFQCVVRIYVRVRFKICISHICFETILISSNFNLCRLDLLGSHTHLVRKRRTKKIHSICCLTAAVVIFFVVVVIAANEKKTPKIRYAIESLFLLLQHVSSSHTSHSIISTFHAIVHGFMYKIHIKAKALQKCQY